MVIVTKNTYPVSGKTPHAEVGDVAKWELSKGCYRLIRQSDGKTLFSTPPINKDLKIASNNQIPKLFGVIAEVKSKNWQLSVDIAD